MTNPKNVDINVSLLPNGRYVVSVRILETDTKTGQEKAPISFMYEFIKAKEVLRQCKKIIKRNFNITWFNLLP